MKKIKKISIMSLVFCAFLFFMAIPTFAVPLGFTKITGNSILYDVSGQISVDVTDEGNNL